MIGDAVGSMIGFEMGAIVPIGLGLQLGEYVSGKVNAGMLSHISIDIGGSIAITLLLFELTVPLFMTAGTIMGAVIGGTTGATLGAGIKSPEYIIQTEKN